MKTSSRKKSPFWLRSAPRRSTDITKLRPPTLPKGLRFETSADVERESIRSEALLQRAGGHRFGINLSDCREHFGKTYCPRCARRFRRWLIGELLRLSTEIEEPACISIVLLETAERDALKDLKIAQYRHSIRRRLDRAGLGDAVVVGGFEIIYRAATRTWVLHVNLLIFSDDTDATARFLAGLSANGIDNAVQTVKLSDPAEQLSYRLKFSTYHRPHKQCGPTKAAAKPLNHREWRRVSIRSLRRNLQISMPDIIEPLADYIHTN